MERLQEAEEEEILEEEAHREEELVWINSFKDGFSEIESVLDEILALPNPKMDKRGTELFTKLTDLSQNMVDDLGRFHQVAQGELERSIQVARHEERLSDKILFLSVLGMALVGIAFTFFFSKSIARPIIDLRNRSLQIGLGNFDYPVVVSSVDEIGDLDRSFQNMATNLKELYGNLEELVQERTEELKGANEHLQQLFNGITDGILVINRQFKIVDANSGLRGLVGLPDNVPPATSCYASCAGRNSACERCPAVRTFETGQSNSAEMMWEVNGRKLHVEIRTFPLSQNGQSPSMVIEYIKDVSEKRKMEEQLLQSSKLAAIGTLSAGIAHEINNPLSSIAYAAEVAANHLKTGDASNSGTRSEIARHLKTVQSEVYHCKAITQGLLDFSRESETERDLCDMNDVVISTLALLDFKTKKKNVSIRMNLGPAEAYLIGDRARLKQVMFNVLSNALDAVSEGGKIRLAVRKEGDIVLTEITDDGVGIASENLGNILDPFYTTKPVGQGAGLGLAVCYGIIRKHKGEMSISSPGHGRGTSVTFRLPVK